MSAEAVIGGLGLLGQIAGSYYNNMMNAKNQLAINKANIGMQYAFNADQIAVAQMNNQTQIDMANTAHQREVQDLRDAGLNPILSATGGNGAAMPSLGNPSGISAPEGQAFKADNPLRELGTSAREIGRYLSAEYKAEVEIQKEQALQQKELTKQLRMDTRVQSIDSEAAFNENVFRLIESKAKLAAQDQLKEAIPTRILPFIQHINSADAWGLNYRYNIPVLNDEVIDTIKKGILADYENQRWSSVRNWIGSFNQGAGGLNSLSSGASTLRKTFKRR